MESWFIAGMAAAALFDLLSRRIPNALNVAIFAGGVVAHTIYGGPSGLGVSLGGAALTFGALLLLFRVGWIAGGDVKLAAAIGAWLGPERGLEAIVLGLAGGGVLALVITLLGGRALRAEVLENLKFAFFTQRDPQPPRRPAAQKVPLGVALGAAAVAVLVLAGGPHV